mgnify:CR=1 FL=1
MAVNVYKKAALYYARGWWSLAQLEALEDRGVLTAAQIAEIIGSDYAQDGEPDLESMTKHQLRQYAEARGIAVYESWTKAEIIAAIQGAD